MAVGVRVAVGGSGVDVGVAVGVGVGLVAAIIPGTAKYSKTARIKINPITPKNFVNEDDFFINWVLARDYATSPLTVLDFWRTGKCKTPALPTHVSCRKGNRPKASAHFRQVADDFIESAYNSPMKTYGSQSMIAPLQTVLVRQPDEAFGNADPARWHYAAKIDLAAAQAEHAAFVGLLTRAGVEVAYHTAALPDHADAIFVHDPVIVCNQGAVILRMAKGLPDGEALRQGEEDALARTLEGMGVPIRYRLHGDATAEGGDLLWVDEHTLAAGQGFRTNAEGLRQLQEAMPDVNVIPVHLPYADGPEACLHLMSFISIVGEKLAVVYLPHMPVPFYQFLQTRGFRFVEVPEEEYRTMGPNVLALSPSVCVMLEGNPITQTRLEAAGCTVYTYKGDEISLKAEGGATCLTRPVLRI